MKVWPELLFSILLIAGGCATNYQSKNIFGFGFSEIKTNTDSFIVSFKGNGYSDSEKVMKYALRRAAELTLGNGFKYFCLVSSMDKSEFVSSNGTLTRRPAMSIQIKCSSEKTNNPQEVDAEYFLAHNVE
ncbi:MAG: CC0125/CC1285 family lipoprotein [Anaerolineae bacterium]